MIKRKVFDGLSLGILALNLMLFLHYAFVVLFNKIVPVPTFGLYEGVGLYFNEHKIHELLVYAMDVVSLFVLFGAYVFRTDALKAVMRKMFGRMYLHALRSMGGAALLVLLSVLLPLALCFIGSQDSVDSFWARLAGQSLVLTGWWFAYGIDRKKTVERKGGRKPESGRYSNTVGWILLLVCYGQLVSLVYEPLVHRPRIINEYYAIPEQTVLDGKYVDNTDYLRQSIKSPIFYKYDVASGDVTSNIVKSDSSDKGFVFPHKSALTDLSTDQIFYDKRDGSCAFNMKKPLDGLLWIDDAAAFRVLSVLAERNQKMEAKDFPPSLDEFLGKNKYELHQQVLSRFMIHHHNFVLSPVNELSLGKNVKEVGAQYGLGSALIFNQILQHTGGVTLQGWLKLCYLFYLVYFALFILIVYRVSNSIPLTSFVFMLSMAVINMRGYDIVLMPPGESPWRHMLDVLVMYSVYRYQKHQQAAWYVVAGLLAVLSVYINPQVGVMILIAYAASMALHTVFEKKRYGLVLAWIIIVLAAGFSVYLLSSSRDQLGEYYLKGVVGVKILYNYIILEVALILVGYYMLYRVMQRSDVKVYLPLMYLFFYSQALLFYVAWHFDVNGITSRFFIYILTYALLAYYSGFAQWLSGRAGGTIAKAMLTLAIVYYGVSIAKVYGQMNAYSSIFENHKSYNWNFDRAKIESTMDPVYFEQSVKLINTYSAGHKGIYIISKYDNILPFLSGRYSEMPFHDLSWYLITDKEVEEVVNRIRTARPEYLYVDTDIYRNYNNDIIDNRIPQIGYLSTESTWRVQRLKLLNKVYEAVQGDYALKERGSLITVYQKK